MHVCTWLPSQALSSRLCSLPWQQCGSRRQPAFCCCRRPPNASRTLLSPLWSYYFHTAVRVVTEGSWRHFFIFGYKTRRIRYESLLFCTRSTYLAPVQQKLQQWFVQTLHLIIQVALWSMTAVLMCCHSKPSERAAVCFVPPVVAVCLQHAYLVCLRVLCTCHVYPLR